MSVIELKGLINIWLLLRIGCIHGGDVGKKMEG